jgi:two-component system phosphate regulon response regulator OmpR
MMKPKILVVDDDARLRALLERYLTEQDFEVLTAGSGQEMQRQLARRPVDLMVLDVMLPGEDGLSVCRRLRAEGNRLPIIMLTAKGDEMDRIIGLEFGADDYLAKPFNPRELAARVRAVLRRLPQIPAAPDAGRATVSFGPFRLDLASRQLFRDETPLPITSGEFSLLKVLVQHPGAPLSRDRLAHLARGRDYLPDNRSIDVQISRLRRLLEADPAHPRYLQTVWGVGYMFVPDGNAP